MADEHGAGVVGGPLATYLTRVLGADVQVLRMRGLGSEQGVADPKGFGYGVPFEAQCLVDGCPRAFVISRTRPAQGFGHDYPADRAWQALYGHAAYNSFPRHVRSVDVGFVRSSGELVSAGDATEFFQVVEKAGGALYWLDLERLVTAPLRELDRERVDVLSTFLAAAHSVRRDEPTLYQRRIRELVGHGECLMGILDSYPHPYPLLPPDSCEALERAAVSWRWRLRRRAGRLARVHGDFHPWNILFGDGTDFALLDRSRGEWGEPADDISALAINYILFGLRRGATGTGLSLAEPFSGLLERFVARYAAASDDRELADVIPPFLAFRALVVAHPRWYPSLPDDVRRALLHLARNLLDGAPFVPERVAEQLGVRR
jgi:hypothetical protein